MRIRIPGIGKEINFEPTFNPEKSNIVKKGKEIGKNYKDNLGDDIKRIKKGVSSVAEETGVKRYANKKADVHIKNVLKEQKIGTEKRVKDGRVAGANPEKVLNELIGEYERNKLKEELEKIPDKASKKARREELEQEFQEQRGKRDRIKTIDKKIDDFSDKKRKQGGALTTEQAQGLRELKEERARVEATDDANVFVNGEEHSIKYGERWILGQRIENVINAGASSADISYPERQKERDKKIEELYVKKGKEENDKGEKLTGDALTAFRKEIDDDISDLKKQGEKEILQFSKALSMDNIRSIGDVIKTFVGPKMNRSRREFKPLELEWAGGEKKALEKQIEGMLDLDLTKANVKNLKQVRPWWQESKFEPGRFESGNYAIGIRPKRLSDSAIKQMKPREKEIAERERAENDAKEPWIDTRIEEYAKSQKIISLLLIRMSEKLQWGDTKQRKEEIESEKANLTKANENDQAKIEELTLEGARKEKEKTVEKEQIEKSIEDRKKEIKYDDIAPQYRAGDSVIEPLEKQLKDIEEQIKIIQDETERQVNLLKQQQEARQREIEEKEKQIKTAEDSYKQETENDGLADFLQKNPDAAQDWLKIQGAMELQKQIKKSFELDIKERYKQQIYYNTILRDQRDISGYGILGRNFWDMVRFGTAPFADLFKGKQSLASLGILSGKARAFFKLESVLSLAWQTASSGAEFVFKELFLSPAQLGYNLLMPWRSEAGIRDIPNMLSALLPRRDKNVEIKGGARRTQRKQRKITGKIKKQIETLNENVKEK